MSPVVSLLKDGWMVGSQEKTACFLDAACFDLMSVLPSSYILFAVSQRDFLQKAKNQMKIRDET